MNNKKYLTMFFPLEALFALHHISEVDLATLELSRFQEYFSHLHLNIEGKNEFFCTKCTVFYLTFSISKLVHFFCTLQVSTEYPDPDKNTAHICHLHH